MKRDLSLDLIRSVAIIFLICLHFIAGTGWYELPTVGAAMLLVNIARCLFINCVPLFLLLTGYLCGKKTLRAAYYLRLVRIYVIYLLACAACLLFKAFYLHTPMTPRYILGAVFNHYACDYSWYVAMYTGLLLMIPFFNLAFWGLKTRNQRRVLVWTAIFLGVAPSLFNLRVNLYYVWWPSLYPAAYYFVGLYLREYPPTLSRKKAFLLLLAVLAASGLLNALYSRPNVFQWEPFTWFEGFECLGSSVLLFILLRSVDLSRWPASVTKGLVCLSRLSFSVYLFSYITDALLHPLLRTWIASPLQRFWLLLPCVVLSLSGALLLACLCEMIAVPAEKAICTWLVRMGKRFSDRHKLSLE